MAEESGYPRRFRTGQISAGNELSTLSSRDATSTS
jgi:hypothetical protein